MLNFAPINCLLGLLCGTRCRVYIVLPLIVLAVVEAILVNAIQAGSWISEVWNGFVLIACLEIGYVIGAALVLSFPVSLPGALQKEVRSRGTAKPRLQHQRRQHLPRGAVR